jgi:membrane-bound inhibitor of C-type lysozyme
LKRKKEREKAMKRICRWRFIRSLSMASVIGLALIGGNAHAQTGAAGNTISVNGTISSITGSDLTVMANSGPVVVKFGDKTIIRGEEPVKFSDITSGMYVGATAEKQPDGTFRASRLHIFSEDQRGTGEGHRPLTSAQQSGSTMTNANVETVEDVAVENVKGRMLTLKYKGGEIKVLVPADTPVVKRVVGDRRLLTVGSTVSASGARADDGAIVASQITVRASAN